MSITINASIEIAVPFGAMYGYGQLVKCEDGKAYIRVYYFRTGVMISARDTRSDEFRFEGAINDCPMFAVPVDHCRGYDWQGHSVAITSPQVFVPDKTPRTIT